MPTKDKPVDKPLLEFTNQPDGSRVAVSPAGHRYTIHKSLGNNYILGLRKAGSTKWGQLDNGPFQKMVQVANRHAAPQATPSEENKAN